MRRDKNRETEREKKKRKKKSKITTGREKRMKGREEREVEAV